MNNQFLLPTSVVAARNSAQQLKVIMNLPVRLTTENQVLDIFPLKDDPDYIPKKVRRNSEFVSIQYPTLNDLTYFFKSCMDNDLLTRVEVARIYQVSVRTIDFWGQNGVIKRYRIAPGLTAYKRSELPTLEALYGPYEL